MTMMSFDISETAVEITRDVLRKYGMDASRAKVAGIMDTGYETETFDGVIAHAVVDHLTLEDARKAIRELYRITRKNGLLMVSFDMAEEECCFIRTIGQGLVNFLKTTISYIKQTKGNENELLF